MIPVCDQCGKQHIRRSGSQRADGTLTPGCAAHQRGVRPLEPCGLSRIVGGNVCHIHGGNTPSARAAAANRLHTQEIEKDLKATLAHSGIKGVEDPYAEMARLASEAMAFKDALAARVNALETTIRYSATGAGTEQLRSEVALYERALDRTGRFLDALVKSGFEERRVRIDEQTAAQVAAVMQRILAALHLTPEQQAMVSSVVPKELRALEAGH